MSNTDADTAEKVGLFGPDPLGQLAQHRNLFAGLFLGWGLGTLPLILMWPPPVNCWSGASWGAILSIAVGLMLFNFHEEGEQ